MPFLGDMLIFAGCLIQLGPALKEKQQYTTLNHSYEMRTKLSGENVITKRIGKVYDC